MSLAGLCIRRPIGTLLLAFGLFLAGLLAWRMLPIAALPQIDLPVIVVEAGLPGASPESMAATVAAPLERALGSIAGVRQIISSSSQSASEIEVEFELEHDIHQAARDVQAAINEVRSQLPSGMPSSPRLYKIQAGQRAFLVLALSSESLPPSQLYDHASTVLAQRIAATPGVSRVNVQGASLPAVRVQIDAPALSHRGLALDDVRTAIAQSNVQQPLGAIQGALQRWQLSLAEVPRRAADFASLIIRWQDGRPVRLSDVAKVHDSTENRYRRGFHNEREAVLLYVYRQNDANIVETAQAIQKQLPYLRALLPAQVQLEVVLERTANIRATLREAYLTLGLAILLVIVVIVLFLGRLRTALVPALAIPVSLIGACIAMYAGGFSLNNLSLMALIVAAGLVVDDAIVVLENIERHIERGLAPIQAALRGAREVGFTLLAMNGALLVVFVSVLFMGGMVERLFREFSITLAACILISLLVSLTLIPVLCAYGLRPQIKPAVHGSALAPIVGFKLWRRLQQGWRQRVQTLQPAYERSLNWAMQHGRVIALLLLAVMALNAYLYQSLPMTPLPRQDSGIIRAFIRGDDGFSFQIMQPKIDIYRQLILNDPAVAHVSGSSGGDGASNSNLEVSLKPLAERRETTQTIVERLRKLAPAVAGATLSPAVEQDLQIGGVTLGDSENELVLRADDIPLLRTWARKVALAMQQMPELVDVPSVSDGGTQQVMLDIDRLAAARLGIDINRVASVLNNTYAQRQITTLYQDMNQYHVVLEVDSRHTSQPQSLDRIEVLTGDGQRVPLSAFSNWRYGLTEDRVAHANHFAVYSISYGLAEGITEQQAMQAIDAMLARLQLPSKVHRAPVEQHLGDGALSQVGLLLFVLLAVYLLLAILYESTWHPLTILSTLPPAGVGALLALHLGGSEFSLIALLGLFLLIGVVMKNAILMIDVALDLQKRLRLPAQQAIAHAASLRLRPILMTNLAAILGALPLMLGQGQGAELRQPMGLVIVGGLLLSQLLTLYTTPVIFLALERLRLRARALIAKPASTPYSHEVSN